MVAIRHMIAVCKLSSWHRQSTTVPIRARSGWQRRTRFHRLMLRAGMIKRVAAGIYTWMPLGLRVLRKVEAIVREEMNRSGAIELLMPVVQPAEMWQESGRWAKYGPELLRLGPSRSGLRRAADLRGGRDRRGAH